jgi:hypothetical protein
MDDSTPVFERLLQAARTQAEPQRLLFVFAQGELPEDASAAQRAAYAAGLGGALTPIVCVDKSPAELDTFEALVAESRTACPPWEAVFIGALDGQAGREPSPARVEQALTSMVNDVRVGRLAGYLALDPRGDPLQFAAPNPAR